MTKAEIIQGLKKAMTICDSVYAYDMDKYIAEAIKALEQEPTTKNNLGVDCISRAEAIRVASGYCHPSNIAKELANLPSVTPQPRKGHWIFVGEENEEETKAGNFRYVCSECGFSDVHGKSTYVPYCWQCGAKMAESEEV